MWGHAHILPTTTLGLPAIPRKKKREIQLAFSATCLCSSWDRLKPQGHNSSFALYLPMNLRVETSLFFSPGFSRQRNTPDKATGSLPSLPPSSSPWDPMLHKDLKHIFPHHTLLFTLLSGSQGGGQPEWSSQNWYQRRGGWDTRRGRINPCRRDSGVQEAWLTDRDEQHPHTWDSSAFPGLLRISWGWEAVLLGKNSVTMTKGLQSGMRMLLNLHFPSKCGILGRAPAML